MDSSNLPISEAEHLLVQRSELRDEIDAIGRERSRIVRVGGWGTIFYGATAVLASSPVTLVVLGFFWVFSVALGFVLHSNCGRQIKGCEEALADLDVSDL